jgi:hypothetical protein
MSFNPNIPLPTDKMLQSQTQIRANYQQINSVFGENHAAFTSDKSIRGMHNELDLYQQAGDPTTASNQIALYTKAVSSIPMTFFRPSSDATPIQLTYPSISTGPNLSQQYSFIAGPFIIYGGLLTGVNNGAAITLTPTSTLIYVGVELIFQGINKTAVQAVAVSGGSGFTLTMGVNNQNIYYLAIGQ